MHKNILFLQGPVGSFFRQLADFMAKQNNVTTYQITFNGGDEIFSRNKRTTAYLEKPKDWSEFLKAYVFKHNITDIVVFGDCRFYHRVAKSIASEQGLDLWAFEEGYLRPSFITLEQEGVNSNSLFSMELFEKFNSSGLSISDSENMTRKNSFCFMSVNAFIYYLFKLIYSYKYKHYIHHRPWLFTEEVFSWVRSGIRRIMYTPNDYKLSKSIKNSLSKQYFLVPLQVSVDSQILFHSPFGSVEEFISTVIESFAKNAAKDDFLIFKHHPMDRGFNNYQRFIKKLCYAYDLNQRVFYCHDAHLPSLLKHAKGTITVNSTVGISSLHHGTPTKVLGNAIYNIEGMTSQKELHEFWKVSCQPCEHIFSKFTRFLKENNQIPGSFYMKPTNTFVAISKIILS
ncbi:capsular biosynthesis protein [uncultured Paraglaciecola sp.]|uniref:capsule biosynthesis protein n=1 Tax=uncultured Paraglaciecola sp. TaxID=1765024 RepID=UPI0030D7B667|tara:strand:- start:50226 stop:51422 length:1197 start_codon:yes stop_codon:yes gene_type:complete